MRIFSLVAFYAVLCLLDAATTVHLAENFPEGRELNPYVDPASWSSLLVSPSAILLHVLFLGILILSEKNFRKLSPRNKWISDAILVAYISIFMIFMKTLAIINNLMPMIGISTPISHVLRLMQPLPGDEGVHYGLFWGLVFLLLAPLGTIIVKKLYGLPEAALETGISTPPQTQSPPDNAGPPVQP